MRLLSLIFLLFSCVFNITAQDTFFELYSKGLDLINEHQFDNAIEVLDKAYESAPPNSQERSRALYGKGMALYMMAINQTLSEDYSEAYMKYGDAMKCFRRIARDENVMDCAISMANLNSLHFGCLKLAIEQYEYAYDIAKKLDNPEKQIEILDELIRTYRHSRSNDDAVNASLRLDSILIASRTPESVVTEYIKRGDNAVNNGDLEIALSFYNKALSGNTVDKNKIFIYQKLRDTYFKKREYEKALAFSNKCVALWREEFKGNDSQRNLIYATHYLIQLKAGLVDETLASIDSITKSVSQNGSAAELCQLFMDKGRIYADLQDWESALKNYRNCDSIAATAGPTAALYEKIQMYVPLYAGALYQSGDYKESHAQYVRYLDMIRNRHGAKSMEYARAQQYLANIEGYLGRLDEGAEHYIESWETARDITCQDLMMLPSNARGKYWNDINDLMWHMVPYALAAGYQENKFTSSAFEAVMMSKGLLLTTEKTTGNRVKDSGDAGLIAEFSSLADLRNKIEYLKSRGEGEGIMRIYTKLDSLDRRVSVKLSEHGIINAVPKTSCGDVVGCLGESECVIDFSDFVKKDGAHVYAAFVLRRGMTAPRLIRVFEQSRLDSILNENNGKYSDLYSDYNQEAMYDIIWEPLMKELTGIKTIYFVPSGILNQIAVEAVEMPGGQYAGDSYNIVRLTNSREVLSYKSNRKMSQPERATLYGGLYYDVEGDEMLAEARSSQVNPLLATRGGTENIEASKGFETLRMSEEEVIEIASTLAQRNIKTETLMKTKGTEESFFSMDGNSPDLLLLSTHGFYYSPENVPSWSSLNGYDNPMYLTGLVMSGGNAEYLKRAIPDGVMGGLLTSSDISRLDLSGTRMVVLSACETGLGETSNEGVYGLQRAFKRAGVQTLVMSLWPVSDKATKEFMVLFHKKLADNGWNKREAFASARQTLRQKYPDPYYWSAFIMVD